jgi:hypothetical protein
MGNPSELTYPNHQFTALVRMKHHGLQYFNFLKGSTRPGDCEASFKTVSALLLISSRVVAKKGGLKCQRRKIGTADGCKRDMFRRGAVASEASHTLGNQGRKA